MPEAEQFFELVCSPQPFPEAPVLLTRGALCDHMTLPSFPWVRLRAITYPDPVLAPEITTYENMLADMQTAIPAMTVPSHYYIGEELDDSVRVFQVVQTLTGTCLGDLNQRSSRRPSDRQLEALVDGLVAHHRHILDQKAPYLNDLKPEQFTYGNVRTNTTDKIYYHDLDLNWDDFEHERFILKLVDVYDMAGDLANSFALEYRHRPYKSIDTLAKLAIKDARREGRISRKEARELNEEYESRKKLHQGLARARLLSRAQQERTS